MENMKINDFHVEIFGLSARTEGEKEKIFGPFLYFRRGLQNIKEQPNYLEEKEKEFIVVEMPKIARYIEKKQRMKRFVLENRKSIKGNKKNSAVFFYLKSSKRGDGLMH